MRVNLCECQFIRVFHILAFILISSSCVRIPGDLRINQIKAHQTLQSINVAQVKFKAVHGHYGSLQELSSANLIDPTIVDGNKNGYRYEVRARESCYEAVAMPQQFNITGVLSFYSNDSGVIRGAAKGGKEASSNDAPVTINDQ